MKKIQVPHSNIFINNPAQARISKGHLDVPLDVADNPVPKITYEGTVDRFPFSRQQKENYEILSDILASIGDKFTNVYAVTFEGEPDFMNKYEVYVDGKKKPSLTKFIVVSKHCLWYKYEGVTAGGGSNTIYIFGQRFKISEVVKNPQKFKNLMKEMVNSDEESIKLDKKRNNLLKKLTKENDELLFRYFYYYRKEPNYSQHPVWTDLDRMKEINKLVKIYQEETKKLSDKEEIQSLMKNIFSDIDTILK